jgi:hypothetical protein
MTGRARGPPQDDSSSGQLAGRRMQCPLDTFGIAREDSEVGFSRLVGLRAALFSIPQSAKRDVVGRGEFLLGQRQGADKVRHSGTSGCGNIRIDWRV